jgi:hypothetical protein
MSVGHKIVDRIEHVINYFLGLVASCVDDYTLITLVIFTVLLGLTADSALVALATFFGAYFLLRLIGHMANAITTHAQIIGQATVQAAATNRPPMLETDPQLESIEDTPRDPYASPYDRYAGGPVDLIPPSPNR